MIADTVSSTALIVVASHLQFANLKVLNKLFEFKESEANSEFNSRKVKKIEFSDTMTKETGHKKNKKASEKVKGDANFTHSSIDKLIFNETDEIDDQINSALEHAEDRSIAETLKRNSEKKQNDENPTTNPEKEGYNDASFENPKELSHEFNKYSLRSSIDEKFYEMMYDKQIDLNDLQLPSINNSLIEYQQSRQQTNKHLYENRDIQNQDSVPHQNSKPRKGKVETNEKKATKKEFESKNKAERKELDQDEIDRNSTVKKTELNEAIDSNKAAQKDETRKKDDDHYKSKVKDYIIKDFNSKGNLHNQEDEMIQENPINFDGHKSGEDKRVNYSVLSRSKSGDAKLQSNSKCDKESIQTNGEIIYYGKSKESNGSKQVLIEEIEIPLDEQHEDRILERK